MAVPATLFATHRPAIGPPAPAASAVTIAVQQIAHDHHDGRAHEDHADASQNDGIVTAGDGSFIGDDATVRNPRTQSGLPVGRTIDRHRVPFVPDAFTSSRRSTPP